MAPGTSKIRCSASARDSGTNLSESRKAAMPTGTLTKKIHGHEKYSVSTPPRSRPIAAPPVAIPAQTPIAFVRCGPSGKVVVRIESAAGATKAAPRPCRPRPTISNSGVFANPFRSEATVKMTTPTRNTRLRPRMSPARPPSSRKPPKISV